jgi:hypothetical protein
MPPQLLSNIRPLMSFSNCVVIIAGGLTYDVTTETIEDAFTAARADGSAVGVPNTTPLFISVYKQPVATTLLLNSIFERGGWAKVR